MKKILFPLFLFCLSFQLSAQKELAMDNTKARTMTEKLTALYELDADQVEKMYQIQMRKQTQLTEIQPLETSDAKTYLTKLKAIQNGNEGSIKMLLKPEQLKAYQFNYMRMRKERSDKATALKNQGMSADEIEKAIWSID